MTNTPSIIVHGGAWDIPDELTADHMTATRLAAEAGIKILRAGGSALDAVEVAVRLMEDAAIFDAGRGSFLTADGTIELDAAIMDGSTLQLGSVSAVRGVPNPITLARRVMESGRWTMLTAHGAIRFAQESGVPMVDEADLIHPRELERWHKLRARANYDAHEAFQDLPSDTVGAVAYDADGRIAAATSTGGTPFKYPGRVGDSPLPGCGFYATHIGGASATGFGEAIMRVGVARSAVDSLATNSPYVAAQYAIDSLAAIGSFGGVILLDANGHPGWAFNTPRMAYAWASGDADVQVGI